jgi:hypothetical protein
MKTLSDRITGLEQYWSLANTVEPHQVGSYSKDHVLINCYFCGEEIELRACSLDSPITRCLGCKNSFPKEQSFEAQYPLLSLEWALQNPKPSNQVWYLASAKVIWNCPNGHSWRASPRQRSMGRNCIQCLGRKQAHSSNLLRNRAPQLRSEWSEKNIIRFDQVSFGSQTQVEWMCQACGHNWECSITSRSRPKGTGCPACSARRFRSGGESELVELIKGLGYPIQTNRRGVIGSWELDIYVPSIARAIEFNGDYWHSDGAIQKLNGMNAYSYHREKLDRANAHNIRLAFVWESDYLRNKLFIQACVKSFVATGVLHPMLSKLTGTL